MFDFTKLPWGRFEFQKDRLCVGIIRMLDLFDIGIKDVGMHQSYDSLSCISVDDGVDNDVDFLVAVGYVVTKCFGTKISDIDSEGDDMVIMHYRAGNVDCIVWIRKYYYSIIIDVKDELEFERFVGENVSQLSSDMIGRINFDKD